MMTDQIPVICRMPRFEVVPIAGLLPNTSYEVIDCFVVHPFLSSSTPPDQNFWAVTHQPSGWAVAVFALRSEAVAAVTDFRQQLRGWNRQLAEMGNDEVFMCLLKRIIRKHDGWWHDAQGAICR